MRVLYMSVYNTIKVEYAFDENILDEIQSKYDKMKEQYARFKELYDKKDAEARGVLNEIDVSIKTIEKRL